MGIVPLWTRDNAAFFVGSADVCDYLDFIVQSGEEENFFNILLDNLPKSGVTKLELSPLRPDSTVMTRLADMVQRRGLQANYHKENVSLDLDLPGTWEEYLRLLTSKQRHELQRKIRRLSEMGKVVFRTGTDADSGDLDIFLKLFRDSPKDKAAFLTPQREAFFRSLYSIMAQAKLLRLHILELNARPIAATTSFDYKDTTYLYNSGYDPEFGWLSAGVISKALCIKDSIQRGKKRFDFLKGSELYKHQLGGHEFPLYRCSIRL